MATPNSNSNDSAFFNFITNLIFSKPEPALADCCRDESELDEVLMYQTTWGTALP
jgi:hypothetical protein